jgi:hypothetical protein
MRLNHRLARERAIPDDIAAQVRDIVGAVERADLSHWETIDPRHAVIVLKSAIAAQRALEDLASPDARDRLRLALDSLGQALAAIAEGEPISDERSPKELVQWLAERSEVAQVRLADLLGVSPRQFQRWISPHEAAHPEGDDLRKMRAVARIVNQLRFVLTPSGTIEWFSWPRRELNGRAPSELLDDPEELPELTRIAGSMRATYAG